MVALLVRWGLVLSWCGIRYRCQVVGYVCGSCVVVTLLVMRPLDVVLWTLGSVSLFQNNGNFGVSSFV